MSIAKQQWFITSWGIRIPRGFYPWYHTSSTSSRGIVVSRKLYLYRYKSRMSIVRLSAWVEQTMLIGLYHPRRSPNFSSDSNECHKGNQEKTFQWQHFRLVLLIGAPKPQWEDCVPQLWCVDSSWCHRPNFEDTRGTSCCFRHLLILLKEIIQSMVQYHGNILHGPSLRSYQRQSRQRSYRGRHVYHVGRWYTVMRNIVGQLQRSELSFWRQGSIQVVQMSTTTSSGRVVPRWFGVTKQKKRTMMLMLFCGSFCSWTQEGSRLWYILVQSCWFLGMAPRMLAFSLLVPQQGRHAHQKQSNCHESPHGDIL